MRKLVYKCGSQVYNTLAEVEGKSYEVGFEDIPVERLEPTDKAKAKMRKIGTAK